MEALEKRVLRTRLVASGIIRYHKSRVFSPAEIARMLEILAEELAESDDHHEKQAIQRDLERYGLVIPQPSLTVHADRQSDSQTTSQYDDSECTQLCNTPTSADTQGIPVHSASVTHAQDQQKSGASQFVGMGRTYINMYSQETTAKSTTQQQKPGAFNENSPAKVRAASEIYAHLDSRGWTGSWTWRNWNYNRVPPAIEEAVREKFNQGWSKSKLAREFRLNRRTIIRICKAKPSSRYPVQDVVNPVV